MLVRNGSMSSYQGVVEAVDAPMQALRPWQATGWIAIDALVTWALRDQRADASPAAGLYRVEAEADGLVWMGSSTDGCAAVERIGAVGCQIDVSKGGQSDKAHPAAEAVARAVRACGCEAVAECGRLGTVPDGWQAPARWLVPERWDAPGAAMWTYVEVRQGAHCPVIQVASDEKVAAGRAAWLAWWDALELMAWELSGRALGFTIAAPSVSRTPWLDTPEFALVRGT